MAAPLLHIWNSIMPWLCLCPLLWLDFPQISFFKWPGWSNSFCSSTNDGQDCVQKSTAIGNFERWHCTFLSLLAWRKIALLLVVNSWCVEKTLYYACAKMQLLLVKKYFVDNKQICNRFFGNLYCKTSGALPYLIHDLNPVWITFESRMILFSFESYLNCVWITLKICSNNCWITFK